MWLIVELDSSMSVQHLEWLPPWCPKNVRFLVSARSEHIPTVSRLRDRFLKEIPLDLLSRSEQELYVKTFLKDLGKVWMGLLKYCGSSIKVVIENIK